MPSSQYPASLSVPMQHSIPFASIILISCSSNLISSTLFHSTPLSSVLYIMEGNISLAWAIEVDQAQLGARLEAYVSTKAAITTLRSCLARYLLPPSVHIQNRNIPQEVIDLIADAVKDAVYIPKVQDWTRSQKCVQAKCLVLDHFKPGEFYGSLASDYAHPRNVGNGWIEEAADGRCYQVLSRYLRKITPGGGEAEVRKFALCKDVSPLMVFRILDCDLYRRSRRKKLVP